MAGEIRLKEMTEQLELLASELRTCIDAGMIKLDLTGPRAPSLLLGLVAKLMVEHCRREGRYETNDFLQGAQSFTVLFQAWVVHFGRELQQERKKKEVH